MKKNNVEEEDEVEEYFGDGGGGGRLKINITNWDNNNLSKLTILHGKGSICNLEYIK